MKFFLDIFKVLFSRKYATRKDFIKLYKKILRYARNFSQKYHISVERILKEVGFYYTLGEFNEISRKYDRKVTKDALKAYEVFTKLRMEYLPAKEEDIEKLEARIYNFLKKNNLTSRRDIYELVREYISELRNFAKSGVLYQKDIVFHELNLQNEILEIINQKNPRKIDHSRLKKMIALSSIALITFFPTAEAYTISNKTKINSWRESLEKKLKEDLGYKPLCKEEQEAVLKHFAPLKQIDEGIFNLIKMVVDGKVDEDYYSYASKIAKKHKKILLEIYNNSPYKHIYEESEKRLINPEKTITTNDPVIIKFTINLVKKDPLKRYLRAIGVDIPDSVKEKYKLKVIAEKDREFRVLKAVYNYVKENFTPMEDPIVYMYLPGWVYLYDLDIFPDTPEEKKILKSLIIECKLPKYYKAFVQAEFLKYPREFLKDKGGDCEDYATFLATLSKILGYNSYVGLYDAHSFCVIELKEEYYVIDPLTNAFMEKLGAYTKRVFGKELKFQEIAWYNDKTRHNYHWEIGMPPGLEHALHCMNSINLGNNIVCLVGLYLAFKEHLKLSDLAPSKILAKEKEIVSQTFLEDLYRALLAKGIKKDIPKYINILRKVRDFESYIKEVAYSTNST